MKRYLLDQREELHDHHLLQPWARDTLKISDKESIVGFFGPINTIETIQKDHIKWMATHTDILHLIVTISHQNSRELLLIQRLLCNLAARYIPGARAAGPDVLIQDFVLSMSYISCWTGGSTIYLGLALQFEEAMPLLNLKRSEDEPNELAIQIMKAFANDMTLIDDTVVVLEDEKAES